MKNRIIIEKEEFGELIEALNSMRIANFFQRSDEIEISFNCNKIIGLISDIGIDISISKEEFEKLGSKEAQILLLVLNKSRRSGVPGVDINIDYMVCSMFFIENFYNFYSPVTKNNIITVSIDEELKIILDSLDEIQHITTEKYTLDYIVYNKGDKVELELAEPFKIILNDIRSKK